MCVLSFSYGKSIFRFLCLSEKEFTAASFFFPSQRSSFSIQINVSVSFPRQTVTAKMSHTERCKMSQVSRRIQLPGKGCVRTLRQAWVPSKLGILWVPSNVKGNDMGQVPN